MKTSFFAFFALLAISSFAETRHSETDIRFKKTFDGEYCLYDVKGTTGGDGTPITKLAITDTTRIYSFHDGRWTLDAEPTDGVEVDFFDGTQAKENRRHIAIYEGFSIKDNMEILSVSRPTGKPLYTMVYSPTGIVLGDEPLKDLHYLMVSANGYVLPLKKSDCALYK